MNVLESPYCGFFASSETGEECPLPDFELTSETTKTMMTVATILILKLLTFFVCVFAQVDGHPEIGDQEASGLNWKAEY